MEPLDFSQRPPRSPRERLDGLALMPRTIDKLRASLPGGNLNGYRIRGMSALLLGWLGVDEQALLEVVAQAKTDDDVAAWLREHTDASQYPVYSERLEKRSTADTDPEHFNKVYPWVAGTSITLLFDVLDEDDRRMYTGKI